MTVQMISYIELVWEIQAKQKRIYKLNLETKKNYKYRKQKQCT